MSPFPCSATWMVALTTLGWAAGASGVDAGQIMVSRGALDIDGTGGSLAVGGDNGFSLVAAMDTAAGSFDPAACGGDSVCAPGETISLRGAWSDAAVDGIVTLAGREYATVDPAVGARIAVEFTGSLVLPSLQPAEEVRTRFTFTGAFTHPSSDDATTVSESLGGSGTAVVTLIAAPLTKGWRVARVLYDFGSALPPSWSSRDLGFTDPIGSGYYDGSRFVVSGSGTDIWWTADRFRFTYVVLDGDGSVTARVVSQTSQHPFAKAGIMLRHSTEPSSASVILDVKPGGGLEFMMRSAAGESTRFIAGNDARSADVWLRLTRSDDRISGYFSADGRSWTLVGEAVLPMPLMPLAGLAVTSHDATRLNRVVFDQVSVHASAPATNLLDRADFEGYTPPRLGPPGWISDAYRQGPAKSETHQPRTGRHNGACWTPAFLDCGMYQEVTAPATGSYALRFYASADRAGGLVGANVNGELAATSDVAVTPFGQYAELNQTFAATAGDVIRVWMYSPARPGYVVIDDIRLAASDVTPTITGGSWVVSSLPPPLAEFTLVGQGVSFTGRWLHSGLVPALHLCGLGRTCRAGTAIDLSSVFENHNPGTPPVTAAPGSAVVRGREFGFVEYAGAQYLTSALVELPVPPASDHPQQRSLSAPFRASGTLEGYEVLGLRDPRLAFSHPFIGHGMATVDLLSGPGPDGPTWTVWRIRYTFARD